MGVGLIGSEHRTEMGMRVLPPTATHPNLYIFEGPPARTMGGNSARARMMSSRTHFTRRAWQGGEASSWEMGWSKTLDGLNGFLTQTCLI